MSDLTPQQIDALRQSYEVEPPSGSADQAIAFIRQHVDEHSTLRFARLRSQIGDFLDDVLQGARLNTPVYAAGGDQSVRCHALTVQDDGTVEVPAALADVLGPVTVAVARDDDALRISTRGIDPSFVGEVAFAVQRSQATDPVVVFVTPEVSAAVAEVAWDGPSPGTVVIAGVPA